MHTVVRGLIGGVVGALIGFALYQIVGCRSGMCPLTANRYVSMLIWTIIGVVFAIRM